MPRRRVSLAISLFAISPAVPHCPVSKQSTHTPITITIMSSPSSSSSSFHSSSHYSMYTTNTLTHTHHHIYTTHTQAHFLLIFHTYTHCLLGDHRSTSCTFPSTTTRSPQLRAPAASARTCARSSSRPDLQNSNEEAGGSSGGEQLQ